MKTFTGNPPQGIVSQIAENDDWILYTIPNRFEKGEDYKWESLKLVAKKPVPSKANYWLGWGYKERRFARSKDAMLLAQYRPELHQWVIEAMLAHELT